MQVDVHEHWFGIKCSGTRRFRSMAQRCSGAIERKDYWYFPRTYESYYHLMLHYPREIRLPKKVVARIFAQEREMRGRPPTFEWQFATDPYPYQLTCFYEALSTHRYALFLEPGLGKTKVSLDCARYWYVNGMIKNGVVLLPLTLMGTWVSQAEEHAPDLVVVPVDGAPGKKKRLLETPAHLHLVGYEAARSLSLHKSVQPDLLILDESSKVANPRSKRSKEAAKLGKLAKYVLLMTGTPIGNHLTDLYGQFKIMDESVFGSTQFGFKVRYFVFGGYEGRESVGYQNVGDLIAKTRCNSIRETKASCLDLPAKTSSIAECVLSNEQARVYAELKTEATARLEDGSIVSAPEFLAYIIKLQQITSGFYIKSILEGGGTYRFPKQPKLDLMTEYCEQQVDINTCTVIWAFNKESFALIGERFKERGWQYGEISGRNTRKQRDETKARFQMGELPFIICSLSEAAAMGLNLQRSCYTAYFYDLRWDIRIRQQAIDRIHRIGQEYPVHQIDFLCSHTVDGYIWNHLENKQAFASVVADGQVEQPLRLSLRQILEVI